MSEFDDKPITSPDGDRFGFGPLAKAIAVSISKMEAPDGTVIAVNGPWGSGKSSLINLIRWHLSGEGKEDRLKIFDFRCWWFRGEEALTLAFFQELYSALNPSLKKRTKKALWELGRYLSAAGTMLNASGMVGADKIADSFGKLIVQGYTVEKLHGEVSNALQKNSKRYLIVIDDIDRLSPDDALLIFRLVKSVGRLPNVMYLLAYDRQLAEKIVTQRYPSEGPHYLEKIVQASFELPEPNRLSLGKEFERRLYSIIEEKEFEDEVYSTNLFQEIIAPEIKTPRDVLRILNPLRVTWPAVKGEVHPADFLCLETLRIQRRELYRTLRSNKERLTRGEENIRLLVAKPSRKDYDEIFLKQELSSEERGRLRQGLIRLFPALKRVWLDQAYTDNSLDIWDRQRRVCSPRHFDTYFRFALPDDVLSKEEVETFIAHSGNPEFIQRSLLDAMEVSSSSFGTKAALLLEELRIHASEVSDAQVSILLKTIYSIADRLDVEKNRESGLPSGNMLGLLLLTRQLTQDRFDLKTRSSLLVDACMKASLGWLVDFAKHTYLDHSPPKSTDPESAVNCLTTRDDALKLKEYAVESIREAAQDGSLIDCPSLYNVLRCWVNFAGSEEQARLWASAALEDDLAVARLAKAFAGSSSIGALGDFVARQNPTAITGHLKSIVDLDEFRARAEQVEGEGKLSAEDHEALATFLDAWRRQDEDDHDDS